MTMQWIFGWWNLIFVAPFAVAIIYLLAALLTGVGMGEADVDHDVDADADADHDVDAETDADAGHDADAETDADAHGASAGGSDGVLAWLGVGRVPISLALTAALLTWGAAGFITNALLQPLDVRESSHVARWSIPIAAVCSLAMVRVLALVFTRYIRLNETSARPMRSLIGCEGPALYPIDGKFGMAQVRGRTGEVFQVPCRVGEDVATIPKGRVVRLVAYSSADRTFYAIPG
jgi:membrane protein implicated in regulation of membrane protease activity